jgi:hypothetical protein
MKHVCLLALGLLALAAGELTAGVIGRYNVAGTEGRYTFRGILNVRNLSACSINLVYNDGDSVNVIGRLNTPLKNTAAAQTVYVTWSYYGIRGTGRLTVRRIKGGYATSFLYSGLGIVGRGSGTKSP